MDLQKLEKSYSGTVYTKLEPLLQVNISEYGYDKVVLRNVNFTEYDVVRSGYVTGQSIAILGRSGRGKSTLFRLLAGLETAPTVSVSVDSSLKPVKEGDIGMIDQKYTLFRHMTVKQIFNFAAKRNALNVSDTNILAQAELWDLQDHLNKYPNELSGGQRQRVAIVEKLLIGNHFLILDEPISGLDVVAIDKVKENMTKILSSHEKNTLIFSTHDIDFACDMADTIYVIGLEKGQEGSTIVAHFDRRFKGSFTRNDVIRALKTS